MAIGAGVFAPVGFALVVARRQTQAVGVEFAGDRFAARGAALRDGVDERDSRGFGGCRRSARVVETDERSERIEVPLGCEDVVLVGRGAAGD